MSKKKKKPQVSKFDEIILTLLDQGPSLSVEEKLVRSSCWNTFTVLFVRMELLQPLQF